MGTFLRAAKISSATSKEGRRSVPPRIRRPRLQTILFAVNVVILLLPLGGVALLRIYESALVRQTESELIGQGAFLAAAFRASLDRALGQPIPASRAEPWRPRPATLDLAIDDVRPPAPAALEPAMPPSAAALAAASDVLAVMRDAQVVTLAAMRVVDEAGVVVASTGGDHGRSIAHFEEIERALRGETVSLLRERISGDPEPPLSSIGRGTGIRVFVALPVLAGGRLAGAVLLSRTPRSLGQTLSGKQTEIVAGAAVLLAVVVALTIFTALTIDRPLARLLAQARRAAKGDLGAVVPLPYPVTADVAELSDGFVAMARALEEREDYLRGFAARVSHELKTPLASLKGALELLQDHGESMGVEERARFLSNLSGDVDRLERLVRRLLDLATADVMKPVESGCDAAEIVAGMAKRRGIALAAPAGPMPVAMSAEVLESAVASLVDNARQHGGPGAEIQIELRATAAGAVEIDVADDGRGVPEPDRERIFEPFFTTARASGGTGLGLAILRAVLRAHGGSVALVPLERGARFRIALPPLL